MFRLLLETLFAQNSYTQLYFYALSTVSRKSNFATIYIYIQLYIVRIKAVYPTMNSQ